MLENIAGIGLVSIYYKNSNEIREILKDNPELKGRIRNLLIENLSIVKELKKQNTAIVSFDVIENAIGILHGLKAQGGPALRNNMDFVIKAIESGYLLSGLGINIDH